MKLTVGRDAREGGFALPTILLVATVMLIVLVASIAATAASRVSLDSQYYNQLAEQAAESGIARANECLKASGYTPQWSITASGKNLRPDSDCTGATLTGSHVSPYVMGHAGESPSSIRTRYSIEAPDGTGIGSTLRVVGVTELVRTSSPHNVWRRYEQSLYLRIEPPEAIACPPGFIAVPGDTRFGTNDFCVGKYEAKNVGGKAVSQADGQPHTSISQIDAITAASNACDGCSLISEAQWMTVAHNVLGVASNWSGGSVGDGYIYRGHTDNDPSAPLAASSDDDNGYSGTGNASGDQRRTLTLSNGEVIWDLAGNAFEWTQSTMTTGKPGLSGETTSTQKDYNNPGLQWNSLPVVSRPVGTLYSRSQGVGTLYSNPSHTPERAFLRGGSYTGGEGAGVLALDISSRAPTGSGANIGFRVAYDPSYTEKTIFTFDTSAPGCGSTVQLPISAPASGGTIDWGDNTIEPRTTTLQTHTYSSAGTYRAIYTGPIDAASYSSVNSTYAKCLTRVDQWGSNATPTHVSFYNASNLVYVAEPPRSVTNMANMFYNATSFNQNIEHWDTSNVTNMSSMFRATSFNQPLNGWNTSNVTNIFAMFWQNSAFNQPLNNWDVSNVTMMQSVFGHATSFNQPLSSWNTSKVTNMNTMFYNTPAFNQNISGWNVDNVSTWTSFRAGSALSDANTPAKLR